MIVKNRPCWFRIIRQKLHWSTVARSSSVGQRLPRKICIGLGSSSRSCTGPGLPAGAVRGGVAQVMMCGPRSARELFDSESPSSCVGREVQDMTRSRVIQKGGAVCVEGYSGGLVCSGPQRRVSMDPGSSTKSCFGPLESSVARERRR